MVERNHIPKSVLKDYRAQDVVSQHTCNGALVPMVFGDLSARRVILV